MNAKRITGQQLEYLLAERRKFSSEVQTPYNSPFLRLLVAADTRAVELFFHRDALRAWGVRSLRGR